MTEAELAEALATGWAAVDPKADLFIAGEMGIANTTAAAAMAAAMFGGTGWAGRGTGVDDAGLARKEAAVAAGLDRHAGALSDPWEVLRRLGGREIAAMTGAYLAARMHWVPVVLDGFIACAAAAVLHRAAPARWTIASRAIKAPRAGTPACWRRWTSRRSCRWACGWAKGRGPRWRWG